MSQPHSALQPPDNFHLEAAEGWLGLGNWQEATKELEQIHPELLAHPAVLEVRCQIYAAAKQWEEALEMASVMIRILPEDPRGWDNRSICLHKLQRTAEARDNILRVMNAFPKSATMRYNLACYECQLGRLDQAKHWLKKAFAMDDTDTLKPAALNDPDLEPLWKTIRQM